MGAKTIYSLLFLFLFAPSHLVAQFFLFTEAPVDIDAKFSLHTIESSAKQTFFNALTIKNNSNRLENLTLNITVPEGWRVIGDEKFEISLPPLDSIIVPLRVAVGGNVRGDIGYSVIASISDIRGNTVKNEYCFVKIPRDTDLTIRFTNRIFFLDPTTKSTDFSVLIQNRGNREELINFLMDGNRSLYIGELREALYSYDVTIPPFTDSLFTFRVMLQYEQHLGREMFGLLSRISTIDTVYQNTLWFKLLSSEFKNDIPSFEKPLTFEFFAQGLLDAYVSPNYTATIEGKTLFKGDAELYYYYRNFSSRKPEDFYLNNRMLLGSVLGKWTIELGDTYRNFESYTFGRGGYVSYTENWGKLEFLANRSIHSEVDNFGFGSNIIINPRLYVNTGMTYSQRESNNFTSKLGYLGTGFKLFKHHNFYFQGSFNLIEQDLNNQKKHNEFGWNAEYNSNIGSFTSYIRAKYASDLYYSPYAGRLELFSNFTWRKDPTNHFQLFYTENRNNRTRIEGTSLIPLGEFTSREGKLVYRHFYSSQIEIFGGPVIENFISSGFNMFPQDEYFSSINAKASIGARIKNATSTAVLTPTFEIARSQVLNNPFKSIDSLSFQREQFGFYHLSITMRSRSFMVLAFFTSGPRSAFDQINYLQNSKQSRRLNFMPTFEQFIYRDKVKLQLGLNYANDMVVKSTYTNIISQLNWYLPQDWELQLLGVYSLQNRLNFQDLLETYQTLYLEAGVRKDFNFQQPRVKYHDIELAFFKDYNGNFIQNDNEPGIRNVLVNIERVKTDVIGRIPGEYFGGELLSDNLGRVILQRIPEGVYKITYNPVGTEAGTFSKAIEDSEIYINRSGKYYFPFVEKNKVFGKVILNRSRLSGLGRIDLSNVRITATDSQGRSYSTLTDRSGEFVLFAPVTDEYILNINNIFYENFDLRQNNFIVQFNGYKQFEVNFVFDEKIRRINFAATDPELQAGVMQVRRTTISGKVQDANSLQPLRARVNLVNTRTNSVVASTNSSATSGDYTLSFIAGDNYLLEVVADDYWYLSENLVLQQITTFMNITRDVLLRPVAVGSRVELNIRFDVNSSLLAPESVAELNRLLRQIRNNPTVKLEIQGHCDNLEGLQRPEIALERANAVARFLIENGYSNLEVRSLGSTVPAATNDTEEGRMRNRRIEVVVLSR